MTTPSVPVADLRRAEPDVERGAAGVQLLGSRCSRCDGVGFPFRSVCHRCGSRETARAPLGDGGVLYSWTTVHVSTTRATPYDVGYVDLVVGAEELRVLGQLRPQGHQWAIGNPVTLLEVDDTAEGWAFGPERSAR